MLKTSKSTKSDQNPISPPICAKKGMATMITALIENVVMMRILKEYFAPKTIVHICAQSTNPLSASG